MSNLHLGGGYFTHYNVKAFTLIELLAVIVILAIIALIATPIILGVINDSKEKAFRLSLKNVEHAYEIYETQKNIKPGTMVDIKDLPIDAKNLTGKVMMNEEGKLELKDITDGAYCAKGTKNNLNIIKGTCEDLDNNTLMVKVHVNGTTRDSITVTVEVLEGTPVSYKYEIEGPVNKVSKQTTEPRYTFTGLTKGNYTITVIATNNKVSNQAQTTGTIEELTLPKPTINYTEEEKEMSKGGKITIEYPDIEDENIEKVYRWDDWDDERFEEYTGEIEAKNETIIAIVRYKDTKEMIVASDPKTITNIDLEGPVFTTSVDGGNVTITASDKAGLHETAYSCDGVWQESNICTFTTNGEHIVNVRDALENEGTEETVTISLEYHDTSNASTPVLKDLTPVVYNGTNWVVADTTTKWYDYEHQEWGNAVLLREDLEEPKEVGDPVTVEGDNPDAIAMFVWIPRYEYKIEGTYGTHYNSDGTKQSDGTKALPGEIEVKFISKETIYENTNSEGYRIHPAFWWDDNNNEERDPGEELDGIWVGKFETSHTTLSSSTTANNLGCSNNNCTNADGLRILPNVTSLRYNSVSNFFYAAQSMGNRLNMDGDLHMMKNSEWGAAAYLSQSKYGKYGNTSYTGAEKQVRINNCQNYITGVGANSQNEAKSTSTCTSNTYTTAKGQAASTTGNITGIYDMSGGAFEYVMGVLNKTSKDSGISFSSLEAKYYDNYTNTALAKACNNGVCYGHALSETLGWYEDLGNFVSSSAPWFGRGGWYTISTQAGVFDYGNCVGDVRADDSFRVVLTQS